MANGNQGGQGQKGQKKQQKPERIRLIHGKKIKEENGQFMVVFEALVKKRDGKDVDAGCPVSFYDEDLSLLRGGGATDCTGLDGKIQYKHPEPLSNAGKTIKIRCQVDGSPDEKWDEIDLPEKPGYKLIPNSPYKGVKETASLNWEALTENPLGFLRAHFLRPSIALALTVLFLTFAGGGKLNTVLGILLGIFSGWKMGGPIIFRLATMVGIALAGYLFPGLITKPIWWGIFSAYIIGGIFCLVEELSKDKKGEPKMNWYPKVPIFIFSVMMVLNFLAIFVNVWPEKSTPPPQQQAGRIYLGGKDFGQKRRIDLRQKDNFIVKKFKEPLSKISNAYQGASKDTRDVIDWLASLLILSAYVGISEFIDFFGRKKKKEEGKPEKGELGPWWRSAQKTSIVVEVAEIFTSIFRWVFKSKGAKK